VATFDIYRWLWQYAVVSVTLRDNNVDRVVRVLNECLLVGQDGSIKYPAIDFMECIIALKPSLAISEVKITDAAITRVLSKGVRQAAHENRGRLSPSTLRTSVEAGFANYLAAKPIPYVLATSLSASIQELSLSREPEYVVNFLPRLPDGYDRRRYAVHRRSANISEHPEGWTTVLVQVAARDPDEAFDKAIEHLDTMRGLWNLYFNHGRAYMERVGRQKPTNRIRLGPYHTLHGPDGKPVSKKFLYEPDFYPSSPLRSEDWQEVLGYEAKAWEAMGDGWLREFVTSGLVRYVRALDTTDLSGSFLRLWGLLERITLTERGEKHDQTVRRLLFFSARSEIDAAILNYLKEKRNALIHHAAEVEDTEMLVYQARRFAERVILTYLALAKDLPTEDRWRQFINSPRDTEEMKKNADVLAVASKYREELRRLDDRTLDRLPGYVVRCP
jgi:hypothetical protein